MTTAPAPRTNPLARLSEGYWVQSRQPLASLIFVAPLLVIYEAGVLVLGPERVRNGADAWLRQLLEWLGFGQYFLLPVLVVSILLGWHYTTRQPWRISRGLLWGMTGECLLMALCLWGLAQLQQLFSEALLSPPSLRIQDTLGAAVGFLGAGIYEELLFRLILLALVIWGLKRMKFFPRSGTLVAVLATSLLFAAAHYVGQYGDVLHWYSFLFRFSAGVFFSILFLYRGFGIAAGTHAGYDILVGVLGINT